MSGEGGIGVGEIGDVVEQGIDQWSGLVQEIMQDAAADPCMAQVQIDSYYANSMQQKASDLLGAANAIAATGHNAANRVIDSWGRNLAGSEQGMSFGRWMDLLHPIPGVTGDMIDGHLPASPRSINRTGRGVLLANRAWWIYAPGATTDQQHFHSGTFRGQLFRDDVHAWANDMRAGVIPTGPDPVRHWRTTLPALVGRSRSDWTIWQPGDPVEPNSAIGQYLELLATNRRMSVEQGQLCAARRADDREYAERTRDLVFQAADSDGRRRMLTAVAVAIAAAFALGKGR